MNGTDICFERFRSSSMQLSGSEITSCSQVYNTTATKNTPTMIHSESHAFWVCVYPADPDEPVVGGGGKLEQLDKDRRLVLRRPAALYLARSRASLDQKAARPELLQGV